jgi:hypothetical protein
MHYQTNGQWLPSREQITKTANGARAMAGRHKVNFAANINAATGAVQLVTGDNKLLRTRILGLAYRDFLTGTNVLIAELQDAQGLLVQTNQLVYTNAFSDFRTDVRYTYTKAGLEQDVILRERPPLPEEYGLNPDSTRLEVWTEFLDAPTPQIERRVRRGWHKVTVDRTISFGEMKIGQGVSFGSDDPEEKHHGIAVEKQWEIVDGRTFLVEDVPFRSIVPQLRQLAPPPHASVEPISNSVLHVVSNQRLLPPQKLAEKEWSAKILVGSLPHEAGLVMDYATVHTTDNYTFQSDTTYFISGIVYLGGTTTVEGGTVIKYDSGAQLNITGTIECKTAPYHPAILTAKDDNTVGDIVGTGTLSGVYANTALALSYEADLKYLNVRYAKEAIYSPVNFTVSHSQILHCNRGLHAEVANFGVANVLMYDVATNIYGSFYHGNVEHLTSDQANVLTDDWRYDTVGCDGQPTSSIQILNSLLVDVGGYGIVQTTTNYTASAANNGTIFQTNGGAIHYLANSSRYRDAGTTNITPSLLQAITNKTTCPPIAYSNLTLTTNLVLAPTAMRDTNSPDLGYHYDPLDYAFRFVRLSGATITVSPGTAIGTSGPYGIAMWAGGQFISTGDPMNLNHVARYNMVQENANANWDGKGASLMDNWTGGSPNPNAMITFTDWTMPAQDGNHFDHSHGSVDGYFANCQFHGGKFYVSMPSFLITNSIIDRVNTTISDDRGVDIQPVSQSCLFFGGTLAITHYDSDAWLFRANLFDHCSIPAQDGDVNGANDGYLTGSDRLSPHGTGDVVASLTYQTGPLGPYYQPDNSSFIGQGGATADTVGLYHYTVLTNQQEEGFTPLDIGAHYVALMSYPADDVWVEDVVPAGAVLWADHDTWNWVGSNPLPFSGAAAHKSDSYPGLHHHVFYNGATPVKVNPNDKLFCYVYLDPSDPPQEIMLEWLATDGSYWYHRAYWGANNMSYGDGHNPVHIGNLPSTGGWVRLEVNAADIDLAGRNVQGMAFTLDRGVVTWDRAGFVRYSWIPYDTDGEGLPDYVEDANGNGVKDANESDYTKADTDGDGLNDKVELKYHSDPNIADTDYDGVIDSQEVADKTDPANSNSVKKYRLGYWKFDNDLDWRGEDYEPGHRPMPLAASLNPITSWYLYGHAGHFTAADVSPRDDLRYREIETEATIHPNINLKRGTIRFWYKPDWTTLNTITHDYVNHHDVIGTGTGHDSTHPLRLIEVGHSSNDHTYGWWTLWINPAGTELKLTTEADGVLTDVVTAAVRFKAGWWYQIALTYTNNGGPCAIYTNGTLAAVNSSSVNLAHWPSAPVRANGFRIGCGSNNGEQAEGSFDELETFNYPLSEQAVKMGYDAFLRVDSDQDGLADVLEDGLGTGPTNWDSDGDGIPDGWEFAHLKPFNGSGTSVDPRYGRADNPPYGDAHSDPDGDGVFNIDEYKAGSDPLRAEQRDPLITYDDANSPGDIINIDFRPFAGTYSGNPIGPAAAGYGSADGWNIVNEGADLTTFQSGQPLTDAAGTATQKKLWVFAGPYKADWSQWCDDCLFRGQYDTGSWGSYFGCWMKNLLCSMRIDEEERCVCPGSPHPNYTIYDCPPYCWTNIYDNITIITPRGYYGFGLPEVQSNLIWLPGMDLPGASPQVLGGPWEMGTDNLLTKAFNEQTTGQWLLNHGITLGTNFGLHVYVTGLDEGDYQVYLYSSWLSGTVNGQGGTSKSLKVHSGSTYSWIPYQKFSVHQPAVANDSLLVTNTLPNGKTTVQTIDPSRPLWLPPEGRMEISFPGEAAPAGIQIVKITPPAKLC